MFTYFAPEVDFGRDLNPWSMAAHLLLAGSDRDRGDLPLSPRQKRRRPSQNAGPPDRRQPSARDAGMMDGRSRLPGAGVSGVFLGAFVIGFLPVDRAGIESDQIVSSLNGGAGWRGGDLLCDKNWGPGQRTKVSSRLHFVPLN